MTKAVLATFSDAKTIKTRSVLQIVLEIPIEQADEAMKALGGFPQPASERWVEVVLHGHASKPTAPKEKTPEKWADMKPSKQAGIRCNDKVFIKYLTETYLDLPDDFDPSDAVRSLCNVATRREFDTSDAAHQRWNFLESAYQGWLTSQKYAETAK